MLGRPLWERVAMRATMDRRRIVSTAGLSTFISHLAKRSIIPSDRLERDDLKPCVAERHTPRSLGGLQPATDIESTEVEEVDPLVNEEHDLLARVWQLIGIPRDAGQVTAVMPYPHNRLSLRPL